MRATPELLLLPLLLLCTAGEAQLPPNAATMPPPAPPKQYYIAAVEIGWDYIHWEDGDAGSEQRQKLKDVPQKYIKAVYREYTDGTFTVPKPRPPWIGIQGPVILTKAGDKVAVHFKNLASQPYSISPVGITYWKQSEGAGYDDSTAGQEKDDDAVAPGGYYEYLWDISAKDGPTSSDPECLTYSYSSQVDTVRDANSGLIGALLVCKSSALTEKGERRNPAFVLLFAVFDESKSWYGEIGERRKERFQKRNSQREYHTINGYVNSTLPGLTMCQARNHVFWHLIGMGTAPAIHSIQFQDHTLQVVNHRKATTEVTPMTFITAEMRPATLGRFLISCQIHAHQHDGMKGFFTVEDCPEPPDLRNAKHEEEYSDEDYDEMFNTIIYTPRNPQLQVRTSRGQHVARLEHYIAAEEVTWDYAPHLTPTDRELHSDYLPASPHHLNYRYKKVVYVEYTDGSFTQRKNPERTLLGPLLKGKVSDQLNIVFKNLASHPFNIYPIGLTKIDPLRKSTNAAEKDLRSMGVPPNGTFSYKWTLTTDDGPLEGDQPCLTQLYQSTVSPERDLASGLVGTLLICRYNALDAEGHLLGPDNEWNLTFAVFDENRSWFAEENLQKSIQDPVNRTNPEFYNSNVIYSVNGLMFAGRQFVVCQSDVTYWHVANVGTQSDFLSIYFMGNLFQDNRLYKSVLTLFPMTGMTVAMEMELNGEWEISAFDGSLKSRGMSIYYTVRPCDDILPVVDHDEEYEDISDYFDNIPGPRSSRPQNFTALVKVCKKLLPNNKTQTVIVHGQNDTNSSVNGTGDQYFGCRLKKVRVTSQEGGNATGVSDQGIPDDILTKIEKDGKWKAALNESKPEAERGGRQRREAAAGNWTDEGSGETQDGETISETEGEASGNRTDTEIESEKKDAMAEEKNMTKDRVEENNEILLDRQPQLITKVLSRESQEMDRNFEPANYIKANLEAQTLDLLDLDSNYTTADYNATQIEFSAEYDDYSQEVNLTTRSTFATGVLNPRSGNRYHHYYIAAEEITWDYGIRKPAQMIRPREMRRGMRKFLLRYKKVVFRAYKDKNFQEPAGRGEVEEHLGLMGPLIRAEVGNVLSVTFKNKASRPYSFHLQGVYDRSQGAGYSHTPNAPSGAPGEPVAPGKAQTYNWKVAKTQGPTDKEFDCKAGAYFSTVDKERDLHSGLIGPLIICKQNVLWTRQQTHQNVPDLALLFHTFDETKSWYLEENLKQYCTPPCHANPEDPWYHLSNKFAAINGYVAETLPGLLVPQYQLVRWHLLNVGSDGEYHAVHFHGLPFTIHTEAEHRMGVYNLFPGVFGTVEMRPPTVGTWLVECTVGDHQLAGMRAKLLIYNPECIFPLGMKSGRIQDSQITASDYIGSWEPRLGRLDHSGYINAWMGRNTESWLQVDLLKPMLLHGVQTQGVRSRLRDKYISLFTVSYSLDQNKWITYRENNTVDNKIFYGNLESSKVKENLFPIPFVAQYIRIHPFTFMKRPALRLELLGCDLNSCAFPLGLQKKLLNDAFNASSTYSFLLRTWSASLARLHQEGGANAWRPKTNNPHEWLQVNLGSIKRITGVVTQGARSLLTQMMVTEFSVTVSLDEHSWSSVLEENSHREKIFIGNSDPDEEVLNVFDPPLFGRYLRIHPRGWINDIALRLEVLGCDTQQWP